MLDSSIPDHPTRASKALALIGDAALKQLGERDFAGARSLIELMGATADMPTTIIIAYAVCLAELGEETRAEQIVELLRASDDPTLATGFLDQATAFLPGGAQSKTRRDAFKADAERWLPRGPKISKSTKGARR